MDFNLTDESSEHIVHQLLCKSWGEFEALEFAGYLLFPDRIYKREKSGKFQEIDIVLRVPREPELRKARVQARQIATEDGLDPLLDSDMVDNLEVICTLAISIRNCSSPHEPWEPDPRTLEANYDKQSLTQIWAKLQAFAEIINPAPEQISEDEVYALLCAIAKERNIRPLLVYGPDARNTFVATMASRLLSYMESKSSSE